MAEYRWATWLADALSADKIVASRVIEVDGWQTRGRPPELGFSFLPSGVLEHHTACMIRDGHDPQSCLNGILAGNGLAPPPVSQLLGTFTKPGVRWTGNNPDPHIIVIAAGRSNHAGSGAYPWGAPSGNGSSIGIEWCGPPADGWPDEVIEFREHVTAAILKWNGWDTRQVTTHWEYVQPVRPGAKIDPSGAWYAEPTLAQTEHWDPDLWREMVAATMKPPTPPPPPDPVPLPPADPATLEDHPMIVTRKPNGSYWFTTDGVNCRWSDNDLMDRVLRAYRCTDLVTGKVVTARGGITTLPGNDAEAEAKRQFYMGSIVGPTARPAGVSL